MLKVLENPIREQWPSLCKRAIKSKKELDEVVLSILNEVKKNGDSALRSFVKQFDHIELIDIQVDQETIHAAKIPNDLKNAIDQAYDNIKLFHENQLSNESPVETMEGVTCWRKNVGIENVGLYIPGGSAPLFSTVLMLGIPAKIAKCKTIVLCTPPNKNGLIHPAILYAAKKIGINQIFKLGGAQAIAAMAYGTESIPKVDKIFGPGNQFVTKAKEFVQQDGVAIDMPAGPSEVLVVADKSAHPAFVAADLLSQAEHGPDSQVVLLSDDKQLIEQTSIQLEKQLKTLPRSETATLALKNSYAVLLNNLDQCMAYSNLYAPEHLIINTEDSGSLSESVINAGSVFIGPYSCESIGDYASGTNHTLPTNGYARNYSGVSLDSFYKKITFQQVSKKGIKNIGPIVETMAQAEELEAHKQAVTIRLESLRNV